MLEMHCSSVLTVMYFEVILSGVKLRELLSIMLKSLRIFNNIRNTYITGGLVLLCPVLPITVALLSTSFRTLSITLLCTGDTILFTCLLTDTFCLCAGFLSVCCSRF